jgi:hypothetical protein
MRRAVIFIIPVLLMLAAGEERAAPGIWQDVQPIPGSASRNTSTIRYVQADDLALRIALTNVPHEISGDKSHQIHLPMPDGLIALFSVVESPIMAPALAARYPEIKTFRVFGIDDEAAAGRIDITPLGFHGMIDTAKGTVYIDPLNAAAQADVYLSHYKGSKPANNFSCEVHGSHEALVDELASQFKTAGREPGFRINYRLAVGASFEYVTAVGGGVPNTLASINSTINRVNMIYQRDLGIQLTLIANNDLLYETTDLGIFGLEDSIPLITMLGQANDWIDDRLPGRDVEYDIGHIFGTAGGGVARLGSVCNDALKANGVSTISNPLIAGDSFSIDIVAHELGHQFNANHTFNGSTGSCLTNRNASTAREPGSGSTIMAYAGICPSGSSGAENLQSNADATFHAGSIAEVQAFTAAGAPGSCYSLPLTPTAPLPGNTDPVLDALTDRTIPANTPFVLVGNASDADSNTLRYQWDQMDAGCPTDSTSFGTDIGNNPLFRTYVPRLESVRNFPALGTQATIPIRYDQAEVLPCHNRDLNFRLTVRDNNNGQDFKDVKISVNQAAGPFRITNLDPATPITGGTSFEVTWDIADTDMAPINCASVDFDLISFSPGYANYSVHSLVAAIDNSNDGSEFVTINPVTAAHPRSRVRVKCSTNVFYDLSDADLTVGVGTPSTLSDGDFTAYSFANIAITGLVAPVCGAIASCPTPVVPPASRGGNGDASAFGYGWMLLLAGLTLVRHRRQLFRDGSVS